MKNVAALFGFCFLVITACMIYLVKNGISLRSAPMIKPSVIADDSSNIAHNVILRLAPELMVKRFVLLGILPTNEEARRVLLQIQQEHQEVLDESITFIDGLSATQETISACPQPCWILMPQSGANELRPNSFIEKHILPISNSYISLTWLQFKNEQMDIPEKCILEKRLDLECLQIVSVQDVRRKMKDKSQRYFFMRKYNESDYFLLVQI